MEAIALFSSLTLTVRFFTRRAYLQAIRIAVSAIPKVELHVHLDGAFSLAQLASLLTTKYLADPTLAFVPEQVRLPWNPEDSANAYLPVRRSLITAAQNLLNSLPKAHNHFKDLCTCGGHRSLFSMLEKFFTFTPIIAGDLAAITSAADAFVTRQAASNVVYTEVRFSPHLLTTSDPDSKFLPTLTPRQVTDAVIAGLKVGCKRERVHVNVILCCITWHPEWADSVVDLALEYKLEQAARFDVKKKSWADHVHRCNLHSAYYHGQVVGVDIAAGEEHFFKDEFPALHRPHLAAMVRAHEEGIKIALHAGEVTSSVEVTAAVDDYKASRIGHGYRAVEEGGVGLKYCVARGVHVEVCPTSSYETGGWRGEASEKSDWRRHPMLEMMEGGASVGINSDDPAVFNTSLNGEFEIVHRDMGVSVDRMRKSVRDSLEAAFLGENRGEALREMLRQRIS